MVAGYTLLIYLSGQVSEEGDALVSKGKALGSAAAAAATISGKGKQISKRGANAAAAAANQAALAAPNTSAVQQLVGGETVFYGEHLNISVLWQVISYCTTWSLLDWFLVSIGNVEQQR